MRTTLTLDDDIAIRIKKLQEQEDMTFKEAINKVLREGLQSYGRTAPLPKFEIQPFDSGRCFVPLEKISEALAIAEGEMYR